MKVLEMPYPPITSFPRNANIIAILATHHAYKDWLYSNHIQLHISKEKDEDYYWLMFYQPLARIIYPLINRQYISRELIRKNNINIIEFIKNAIDTSSYVYLCVDTFFVPAYEHYGRLHLYHDLFIYGYDPVEDVFFAADFFQNGKYSFEKVSFVQLLNAYESSYADRNSENFDVQALQVNHQSSFRLDIPFIIESLEDYINSTNTSVKYKMVSEPLDGEFIFGMNIYPVLYVCIETHEYEAWILKALHVLCDHKKLMAERVKYLLTEKIVVKESEALIASFDEINRQMFSIRNIYIKYFVTKEIGIRNIVVKNLKQLSMREEINIRQLVAEIGGALGGPVLP
ncbi:hypothetical protein KZ483_11975 [Paenibacillus sp. sptzw28]|uniref:hypothetical protein n=1 Tax=Paenibacillus sp. sptzw28 TaxID=715179 RepID=UPI001C6EF1B5|nr:hypothetical protein [Paenibacillus sp. sptzw28]QYR23564.1 hypothetical protein KZ483_11975 [Paenibacillus sp. sptzw28]